MLESNPKTILVVGGSKENQLGNCLQEVFRHPLFRYFNWSMQQFQTCRQVLAFLRQNMLLTNPPLLAVSYQPTGRYFWSEVISLGGYDVLVKPFNPPDIFRMVSLAWESWKDRNRSARS
jgi:hypothetical protein